MNLLVELAAGRATAIHEQTEKAQRALFEVVAAYARVKHDVCDLKELDEALSRAVMEQTMCVAAAMFLARDVEAATRGEEPSDA